MAGADKALFDLLYLQPYSDNWGYWRLLNLKNLHLLSEDKLRELVRMCRSDKARRSVRKVYLPIRAANRRAEKRSFAQRRAAKRSSELRKEAERRTALHKSLKRRVHFSS